MDISSWVSRPSYWVIEAREMQFTWVFLVNGVDITVRQISLDGVWYYYRRSTG